jgi:hypothetical protein
MVDRMKTQLTTFPILNIQWVDERRFVEFWSARYPTMNEPEYQSNIGKPLTKIRLLSLFQWKNGGPIAQHKLESIQRNYIDNSPVPPAPADARDLLAFIQQPGGAIWRIFWLHCHDHLRYPIFDQHVYRAMSRLKAGHAAEIPTTNAAKAKAYVEQYLPFYKDLKYPDTKKVDEALWSYGKYLKGKNAL